ncbi:hypothetical protein Zmor_011163 [Zophobas morio]|uniref:Uncharacterized protein n=1 Tax=Zophobas morio TaxID=2755281 RepID=A0AA38MBS4_9CUCU|nr:hypothetical protein Zmor_021871 [Zophobas morio]KAJ3659475.1 hypothetical protein Zmor_011163 [Zophobas morio]
MESQKAENVSKEIVEEFEVAQRKLIPHKSKEFYTREYDKFCEWRCSKNVTNCDEKFVMAYLSQMSKVYKPSSLWCTYSKLKKMLKIKENVDISKFLLVTEYMKSNSVGDEAKKSWVLQRKEIEEFMLKAPDLTYLLVKIKPVR